MYTKTEHDTYEEGGHLVIEPSVICLFFLIKCNKINLFNISRHHYFWDDKGDFLGVSGIQVMKLKGLNELVIWNEIVYSFVAYLFIDSISKFFLWGKFWSVLLDTYHVSKEIIGKVMGWKVCRIRVWDGLSTSPYLDCVSPNRL